MFKEFRQFVLRGNVVDLAVGLVIGASFGALVGALVKDLITPLIGAVGGTPDFSAMKFTINGSQFLIGDFINALLSFVIVAAVVFFFVVRPLNSLMAKLKTEVAIDQATKTCSECLSDIPNRARKCAFCASPQEQRS